MRETWVWSLDREDPLEKEMATHSSILAWRIPWMEEPGGLQSMGSQRVGHNWTTSLSLSHCGGIYDENVSQPHLRTLMWFLLAWYVLITQSDFSFLFSFFKEIIVLCVVLDSVCLQEEESSVSSFIAILNWNQPQFVLLLLFSITLLVSVSFISAPILTISFLLLILDLVHSHFSSSLRYNVRLFN